MPKQQPIYQRLIQARWLPAGSVRPWRATDHLLLVENRFFTEHYTRLFWNDMQAVLLYRLRASNAVLLALEILCALVVLSLAFPRGLGSPPAERWLMAFALLFVLLYAAWRLPRPLWACQVSTRTNVKQFPLPGNAAACRRVLDEIKNSITQIQGSLPETPPDSAASLPSLALASQPAHSVPKQPVLAIHVIAFVLGIVSPFSPALFVLYCLVLIPAWLLQRDFRFPFAVRSAAVMSQIFAPLRIALWILVSSRVRPSLAPLAFDDFRFGLPTVLFSIYGIAAVYWVSIQLTRPRQKTGATVLGLS